MNTLQPILSIRDLSVKFATPTGTVHAVRNVNLEIRPGEVVGIVGESGSGKSTVMLAAMGLLAANARSEGSVTFHETELLGASSRVMRKIRGKGIGMIFQDPMTSLNPVLSVGKQISEAVIEHQDCTEKQASLRSRELLELVSIPHAEERLKSFPHELSGGMRQRIMIAMAVANSPALLIADEPTTALDVTIQAQVLDVLENLRKELNLAIVLVTHDLGVVAGIADSVRVMYAGRLVESGDVRDVFYESEHPYTRALLACSPRLDQPFNDLVPIAGSPPVLTEISSACSFAPRCEYVQDECVISQPELRPVNKSSVACHIAPITRTMRG